MARIHYVKAAQQVRDVAEEYRESAQNIEDGFGHEIIIIDDVIKNMEEAGSPTTKRKHLDEWDGSISARFQEETKVLITATRWAEDDLSGEIYARTLKEEYQRDAGVPGMSKPKGKRQLTNEVVEAAVEWSRAWKGATAFSRPEHLALLQERELHLWETVVHYLSQALTPPSRTRTVLNAPLTSQDAGESMKEFALTDAGMVFRRIFYAYRAGNMGLTCDEVEVETGRSHQSMSARVNELMETGWIEDKGRTRKTRSGRNAIVWEPTWAALSAVEQYGLPIVVEVGS